MLKNKNEQKLDKTKSIQFTRKRKRRIIFTKVIILHIRSKENQRKYKSFTL